MFCVNTGIAASIEQLPCLAFHNPFERKQNTSFFLVFVPFSLMMSATHRTKLQRVTLFLKLTIFEDDDDDDDISK